MAQKSVIKYLLVINTFLKVSVLIASAASMSKPVEGFYSINNKNNLQSVSMNQDAQNVYFRDSDAESEYNLTDIFEEVMMSYKTNITLENCAKLYKNRLIEVSQSHPEGFCNLTFDLLVCWPPTPLNQTGTVKCFSELLGIRYDDKQNATRECFLNGTWSKANYSLCTELDPYGAQSIITQTNIYLTGYIISAVTLTIAIFIFTYFKELRCLRNIIHMNLMWSYLLTYCMWVIILIEFNFHGYIDLGVTCILLITLLHYFHITTFFWMFVEGLYLYILVVRTLTRETFKLRVYVLIGWGTPLFFIIVWTVVKAILHVSDMDEGCSWFTSHPIDYIYQVPTLVVTFANVVFLISIMVVLVTKLRSANTLEIQQYRKAMKALAVLIPLLGVTYAITIYAPNLSLIDMIRAALLSVQGFMVALFYCFLNMEVQNTLRHHFNNWKTEKSLGPNRMRSSSRSKDWSPRSRTESISTNRITDCTVVPPEEFDSHLTGDAKLLHVSKHQNCLQISHHQHSSTSSDRNMTGDERGSQSDHYNVSNNDRSLRKLSPSNNTQCSMNGHLKSNSQKSGDSPEDNCAQGTTTPLLRSF